MVDSGEKALAKLRGDDGAVAGGESSAPEPFDIAVLDESYGSAADLLKGTDVTRMVREREHAAAGGTSDGPPRRVLVIIGCTGFAGEEHNVMAREAGQDHVWGKPLPEPGVLATDLERLIASGRGAGGGQ